MADPQSTVFGVVTFYAFLCTIVVTVGLGFCAYEGAKRRFGWMIHGQKAAGEYKPRKQHKVKPESKSLTVVGESRRVAAR